MSRRPTFSDEALAEAIAACRSWRGVLRALGLSATSSGAIRSVRQRADRLALDHSHFRAQRRWTDDQLADAVRRSRSWSAVAQTLDLASGPGEKTLKGHAARLGLDADHLEPEETSVPRPSGVELHADLSNLRRAGSLLAGAWFTLCGHDVSWPLEPCRYDLLVSLERVVRVQVKSTTVRSGNSWIVWLSSSRKTRVTYDPDEIDYFFIIDGDLSYYLIPVATVGGLHAIHLSAYSQYKVYVGPAAA